MPLFMTSEQFYACWLYFRRGSYIVAKTARFFGTGPFILENNIYIKTVLPMRNDWKSNIE